MMRGMDWHKKGSEVLVLKGYAAGACEQGTIRK